MREFWTFFSLTLVVTGIVTSWLGWLVATYKRPGYMWNWRALVWPSLYFNWVDGRGKALDKEEEDSVKQ